MNLLKRKGSGRKKGLRYLYISNFYQSYLNCYLTIKSYFNRSSNCIVRKNITKIYSKFKSRSDSQQSVVIRFALLLVNHYWIFSSKKEKILVIRIVLGFKDFSLSILLLVEFLIVLIV